MLKDREISMTLNHLSQQKRDAVKAFLQTPVYEFKPLVFAAFKRALDIFVSLGLIVALAPLWLCLIALIKRTDNGPALFVQTRVGAQGKTFRLFKFRSMYTDAEARRESVIQQAKANGEVTGLRFKMKADPRITPVGKVLRRYSLDELPQLLNILKGDMSLVGPRPPIPEEVAHYSFEEKKRLWVKPGLTCIWQVSGRSHIPFVQQVELDKSYIARQSLTLDLHLLYRTVGAVVSGRGAY